MASDPNLPDGVTVGEVATPTPPARTYDESYVDLPNGVTTASSLVVPVPPPRVYDEVYVDLTNGETVSS